jgi:putative two-component system response regulator
MMITPDRILNARILIMDDQESNVRLLEKLLQQEGYRQVLGATDSRLALDLYRSYAPDLLLLDLLMPNRDGFEVLEDLCPELEKDHMPVLVLTADLAQSTKLKALKAGAKDFLTKPFDQAEVLTRIKNMLEARLLYQDLRDQNRILEDKVRERTEELRQTRLEIIQRLSRAAEYHDKGTGWHILRIGQFCGCVARAMGLAVEHADLILSASPMHDIGKIGIPDHILLKAGALSEDEWVIMRTHTTIGAELLSGLDSTLMRTAAQIALTHHERWDGTGYPRKIRGEAIPIEGRIVTLCDVFDALISARPYKESWPFTDALNEVRAMAGTALDPAVVEGFFRALPSIKDVIRRIEVRIAP